MKRLIFNLLILLVFISPIGSNADEPGTLGELSYGELFFAEDTTEELKRWEIQTSYTSEFGNSFLDVSGLQLGFSHAIGNERYARFISLGLLYSEYFSRKTQLLERVGAELQQDQGIQIQALGPSRSAIAFVDLTPLIGHVNFISHETLQLDLKVRLGAGRVFYSETTPKLLVSWSIRPRLHLNSKFGLEFATGQELENAFQDDSSNRWVGSLGAFINL